jgi:hypothetical protein
MKNVAGLFLSILLIVPVSMHSQSTYEVGTGQSCIEPDRSLISLHLGGYGAPREGRFTLQWKAIGKVPEINSMTGIENNLYVLSNGEILKKDATDLNSSWVKMGRGGNIRSIAGANGKLYAVNNSGELLESRIKGTLKWKKAGNVDKSVTSLAGSGSMLFAASRNGSVWTADLSKSVIEWSGMKSLDGIISMAADNRKLFVMNNEGFMYQLEYRDKNARWLKAAYRNGATITEDIRHIAIGNNGIYGISRENILYEGEHRSEGDLTARAMAIKGGDKTAIIINVDVCGLNDFYTGMLKKEIYEKHKIPAEAVFINSSHTHFAPVSQNWLTWQEANQRPDSIFLYSIVKNGILSAIDQAIVSLAPASLYFGRGKTDIGYNRSLKDHQELYDSAVDVVKVDYSGENKDNYLFLASCHPVFSTAGKLHYTISANYPGIARKLVEERTGTKNSLFLQGTAGDINPRDNGEYISGEKLANEVIAVLNRPMTKLEGEISFYLDTINIPVTPWTRQEILDYRAENIKEPGNINAEKNVKWCDLMLKYYSDGTMPSVMPVYVNTINIGNWKLVGFSRETTTGYGFGVKNLWPDKLITVAGYTNDVSSYLPTHMHIEKKGYEGLNSFFWYGQPNVFPVTVDETILNTIKSLER